MEKQYDIHVLSLYLNICKNAGINQISENFYEKYQEFANLYNEITSASNDYDLPLSFYESLTNMKSIEKAILYMKDIVNQKEKSNLNLEYNQKMRQLLNLIKEMGINPSEIPIIAYFENQHINILYYKVEVNEKIKELIKKINIFSQQYTNNILPILKKINQINIWLKENRYINKLYKNANISKKELLSLITHDKNFERNPEFIKVCKKVYETYQKIHTLISLNIKPELYSFYGYGDKINYDIGGLSIEINADNKECSISIDNDKLSHTLMYYKKIVFLQKLTKKILSHPLSKLVKPTEVNEQSLFKYLYKKEFPIDSSLNKSVNELLKDLGIYKEIYKERTVTEFFAEISSAEKSISSNQGKIKDGLISLHTLLEILIKEGYSLTLDNKKIDNDSLLLQELLQKYQRIFLPPTMDQQIKETISEILLERCQDEELIYSSIQNVYNCIDRQLKNKMYEELRNNKSIESSKALKRIISIIKRYARNKESESYTEEEILEFLKSKNKIMHQVEIPKKTSSYYIENDLDKTLDILSEYDESSNMNDVNEILYRLTGIRR